MITLDANILLRLPNQGDPQRIATSRALAKCKRIDQVVVFPQIFFEFWAAATRGSRNGLGLSADRVAPWLGFWRNTLRVLPDPPQLLDRWQELVTQYRVTGSRVHDVRYVAAMQCHGITAILTYNIQDFSQFPITVLDPATI
jgi:predicted nucleic acid-binding protein